MYINDLPQEIILEIFSYLSRQDLFRFHNTVCLLWTQIGLSPEFWKTVDFETVYNDHSRQCFNHLYKIRNLIHTLIINDKELDTFFNKYKESDALFLNVHALNVSSIRIKELTNEIVYNFPLLEDIKISEGIQTDFQYCCQVFSKLQLVSFDIIYYNSGRHDKKRDLINFVVNQHRLRKLVLRASLFLTNAAITEILNKSRTLKSLYLSDDCVSSSAFNGVTIYPELEELTIKSEHFTDDGLDCVTKHCKHLRLINIQRCNMITDTGINYVATNCPLLQKLSMGKMFPKQHTGISSHGLVRLSQGCPQLTYLSATGCTKMDDDGVMSVAISCRILSVIILKGCSEITDVSVNALATNCSLLCKVDLTGCVRVTLQAIIQLITFCKQLKILILAFCYGLGEDQQITNNSSDPERPLVKTRMRKCKSTKSNTLKSYSSEINTTTNGIKWRSDIKTLNLKGCKNMSTITVLMLVKHCTYLTTLTLPNNTKMWSDQQFVCDLFNICTYLNKFSIFNKTIQRQCSATINNGE